MKCLVWLAVFNLCQCATWIMDAHKTDVSGAFSQAAHSDCCNPLKPVSLCCVLHVSQILDSPAIATKLHPSRWRQWGTAMHPNQDSSWTALLTLRDWSFQLITFREALLRIRAAAMALMPLTAAWCRGVPPSLSAASESHLGRC